MKTTPGAVRVCLDLTPTSTCDRFGGFTRYALALLEHLLLIPPGERADVELLAVPRADGQVIPATDIDARTLLGGPLAPTEDRRARRRRLGSLLGDARVRLFHSLYPEHVPRAPSMLVVATAYDLVTDRLPRAWDGGLGRLGRRVERWWEHRGVDRFIAISETTRLDLARFGGVSARRVDVVPLGVDTRRFSPRAAIDERRETSARFGLPPRYFLLVGSDHYRKNQAVVFEAWRQLAETIAEGLVLVGRQIYGDLLSGIAAEARAQGFGARVIWLSDAPDEALPALYRGASALVAPSLYEGFGLTLLEAMACGTPVIASSTPAHHEVAGGAAVYFDPRSARDLGALLSRFSADEACRDEMRALGLERARAFSWDACARLTLAVYRRMLEGR